MEGQQGHFTLVCRDSRGEQLARGGEHVLVSIVHKEKKNWCVLDYAKHSISAASHIGLPAGGFKGCGHGHKGHPGKHHWSCCGSTLEKSECLPQSILAAVSPRGLLRTVEL
ncbi:hypothetical protein GOODEAATRI_003494 [Goodea atripinnis]|uniref:Recombination activating protein 2 n=1 Tax=Goodea atripinnis TaxID=208336 RepID=A0ABV0NIP9_9TELE